MAATHHAAQRPQYSIPPPPPPPSNGGPYNNDDLRLPSIKDLAFQYDRPRHEVSQLATAQGPPEYSVSGQERSARHTQAWGRAPHSMPAPSAIPAHQPHTQQQHTPPVSAGHEVSSKPNEYVVKHDSGGYMTPGIPLSAQVTPVPGSVNTGPGVRSDDHSQAQNKRSRSSSLTPIVSPRDSRPPHAAYPPQYPTYQATVPPPSPYNQMSPVSAAPPSSHPHPSPSHEHMHHHHTSSASAHPGYISYQQYIPPPRPNNIPPQHVHPHAPQHSSHPPSHPPSHVPQHTSQHAPPPPQSHPQMSHPVTYSSPAPAPPPPPPPQEHWEQQHAQPVTPVHHHSHHHSVPPQPVNHGHIHPHPQYSHPPPPPPPPPQVSPTVAQTPQQQPPPPPPQHHAAYQQPVHPLPPTPLPQQQPTITRTAPPLPAESEVRTSSYALSTVDKATSHEKTMAEIVSLCSLLYEFATRYSALNGALPHVQPAQHEVMEMARRANEVVRLLEVLRRNDAPGIERHKADGAAAISSTDDHRPPKRPWEDMSQDGQAQADDGNIYSESIPSAVDIDKTTAEQDMEIIRTKRASTTAGAAASAGQPKSKYRKRSRATPPGKCHSCNIRETPEWRRGPDGARTLCNACGLHYAKLMRKQTKLNSNGEPPPPIDMDTLRASTRAADVDKSSSRPKQDENISPTTHTPQHHQGSFQVVTMMPSQPENAPSSDANSDPAQPQSILPSPSTGPNAGSMHLPPPPPWAASVSRAYSQPFQTQSFMRTNHTSPR